jgi:hypothetical protein
MIVIGNSVLIADGSGGSFVLVGTAVAKLIGIDEIAIRIDSGDSIGPYGPFHLGCESPHGDRLVIGSNPYVYRYGSELRAACAWCKCKVSEETQEWLDNV